MESLPVGSRKVNAIALRLPLDFPHEAFFLLKMAHILDSPAVVEYSQEDEHAVTERTSGDDGL
jgi:hypothetical protein